MIRLRWVLLVVLNLLLTTAVHAQDTWDIHAEAIVSETNIPVLEETFLPPKGGQPSVKASEGWFGGHGGHTAKKPDRFGPMTMRCTVPTIST